MIGLCIGISRYARTQQPPTGRGRRPLIWNLDTALIRALEADSTVKQMIVEGKINPDKFAFYIPILYATLIDTAAFRDYKKRRSNDLAQEVALWNTLLATTINTDKTLINDLRANEEFSVQGLDMGISMIIDSLNNFIDTRLSLSKARADLNKSLDEGYKLYNGILKLIVDITLEQDRRLENAKAKYLATPEDLNPNTRFVDNKLARLIADNTQLKDYFKANPLDWDTEINLVPTLLDEILSSDIYQQYMQFESVSFADDCEFWRRVLKYIVLPSQTLAEAMENKSIYWNDDLNIIGAFDIKTIRNTANSEDGTLQLMPQFKDEEDEHFGIDLFNFAIENRYTYREYINKFINNEQWDADRQAFMDIVIMTAAIAEIINYPAIPVPVTMNEYIEIANNYSSPRSGQFVNGVLYAVLKYLKENNIIFKEI